MNVCNALEKTFKKQTFIPYSQVVESVQYPCATFLKLWSQKWVLFADQHLKKDTEEGIIF